MVWAILLTILIALAMVIVAKFLPDMVFDIVQALAGIFLIGVFASTYANFTEIADLFSRFTWSLYIVGAAGGLLLGRFVARFIPLPGIR